MKKVGIIGMGVVGDAYAQALQQHGYDIVGKDPFRKPYDVTSYDDVKATDCIMLCLPTPQRDTGAISMDVFDEVMPELVGYEHTILIKSTVLPGTNKRYSDEYGLNIVSNPEFLTEANSLEDALNQEKALFGTYNNGVPDWILDMYRKFGNPRIFVTDAVTVELAKYASNAFLATKVIFANEMNDLAKEIGADWKLIAETLRADSRIGKTHLDIDGKGGYGGMCFPKDLNALYHFMTDYGFDSDIVWGVVKRNRQYRGGGSE